MRFKSLSTNREIDTNYAMAKIMHVCFLNKHQYLCIIRKYILVFGSQVVMKAYVYEWEQ